MLKHFNVFVHSDMLKESGFDGDLADFAAEQVNVYMWEHYVSPRVVNVESSYDVVEIRPSMCNSSTWYKRQDLALSVWVDVEKIL